MATARDMLFADVLNIAKRQHSEGLVRDVSDMLERYRIQAKPSALLVENKTARESLEEEFMKLLQNRPSDTEFQLKVVIDKFRMQLKQTEVIKKANGAPAVAEEKKPVDIRERREKKAKQKASQAPLASVAKTKSEPVAGGPLKRQRSRGHCPKCHSMGVVLARSYTGDEYFSCIYCGFQSYRPSVDAELDLPLAQELLGRRFDDQDGNEET